jgi:hypothetical protein
VVKSTRQADRIPRVKDYANTARALRTAGEILKIYSVPRSIDARIDPCVIRPNGSDPLVESDPALFRSDLTVEIRIGRSVDRAE